MDINTNKRVFFAPKPCSVGDAVEGVDTPALLVDMDALEGNLKRLPELMKQFPNVAFRPHCKTHKSPDIARMQIKSGAVGVCCQTVTEAEAMADGGVPDIFISNQVVDKKKLLRAAALTKETRLSLAVDHPDNVEQISTIGQSEGVTFDLVVDVFVGMPRCGIDSDDVLSLVQKIKALPNVSFKGIHCYNGVNQHVYDFGQRQQNVKEVVEIVTRTLESLTSAGIECTYVTGGGTGTFQFEAASGVFTEIQAGSYVMMDHDYNSVRDPAGMPVREFRSSLYVLATVISVQTTRAVVNAGMKAVSHDSGAPVLKGKEDVKINNAGDEHGVISPPGDLKIGQKLWLVPGHCDPTVNLHQWIVAVRGGRVEALWPVAGRGAGL